MTYVQSRQFKYNSLFSRSSIDRRGHVDTSFPLSSHVQSLVANRRRQHFGILAVMLLVVAQEQVRGIKYQVMESQAADISGNNAKVLESLCCGVDHLVNEFPLNLVSGDDWPPNGLVQKTGNRLEDVLR